MYGVFIRLEGESDLKALAVKQGWAGGAVVLFPSREAAEQWAVQVLTDSGIFGAWCEKLSDFQDCLPAFDWFAVYPVEASRVGTIEAAPLLSAVSAVRRLCSQLMHGPRGGGKAIARQVVELLDSVGSEPDAFVPIEKTPPNLSVWALNDCDWYAGASLEDCIDKACSDTGCDQAEIVHGPRMLSVDDLNRLIYRDDRGGRRTFGRELWRLHESGVKFPVLLASTEV